MFAILIAGLVIVWFHPRGWLLVLVGGVCSVMYGGLWAISAGKERRRARRRS